MNDQLITKTSYGYKIANIGNLFFTETDEWVLVGATVRHFQDFQSASDWIMKKLGW